MEEIIEIFGTIFVAVIVIAVLAGVMALPVMWLWNWLMPEMFGLKEISFWQAFGLNLLCGILFRTSSSSK